MLLDQCKHVSSPPQLHMTMMARCQSLGSGGTACRQAGSMALSHTPCERGKVSCDIAVSGLEVSPT